MYKHVVKYEDYDGKLQEKTLWFNLSKSELLKMELEIEKKLKSMGFTDKLVPNEKDSKKGSVLESALRKISESGDRLAILEIFEWIISKAYGERNEDGLFVKNQKVFDLFRYSPAYDEFMFDLLTVEEGSVAFVRGIVPNSDSIKKAISNVNN